MRVVADTNIYISALNFGGPPGEIVNLALDGVIELYISELILKEIEGVLLRKFGWSESRMRSAVSVIRRLTRLVAPSETVRAILDDDPDNRILECALEAAASAIATGDSHLLKLRKFQGILIVSPRELLDRIAPNEIR
jgi:putative PIN family toxin of toxin-antitoxin system